MSTFKAQGNASGTGEVTLQTPNTNTNRAISLPDATTTLVGTDTTDTLTNKTLTSPTLNSPTIAGTPVVNGSLVVSGTAQASTSGTSIDFTGIPSWVKRVTVLFNNVSTSGTSFLRVRLGTVSGFETTGYESSVWEFYANANGYTDGIPIDMLANSSVTRISTLQITKITGDIWVFNFSTRGSNNYVWIGGGSKSLGGTLTQLRVTTVNGTDTFDAGSINILYE